MENRNLLAYIFILLKGMAMGAADVVPGVSGGTIAFISGIYEELITSINNVNVSLLNTLRKEGIKAFWTKLNGNFLLAFLWPGCGQYYIGRQGNKKMEFGRYNNFDPGSCHSLLRYKVAPFRKFGITPLFIFFRGFGHMRHDFTWHIRSVYPSTFGIL